MVKARLLLAVLLLVPQLSVASLNDLDGDSILNLDEDKNDNGVVDLGETDPYNADSDNGGESDGSELQAGRDPLDANDDLTFDSDNDGLINGHEELLGSDPDIQDTDGDGLLDGEDAFPTQAKYQRDEDVDGIPDELETQLGLNPHDPIDAEDDLDGDGLSNIEEFVFGTDLESADSDRDGISDTDELENEDNPVKNTCLELLGPGERFIDAHNHWAEKYITVLQQTKIGTISERLVEGYAHADGKAFAPDKPISRYELLKLALLSSCTQLAIADEAEMSFSDVPSTLRPYESDRRKELRQIIYAASHFHIVQGYPDGSFKPHVPVNRAEALKILFEATQLTDAETAGTLGFLIFPDVPSDAWFAPYISQGLQLGIIQGYDDGTFRPEQSITRAEATKLVYHFMKLNPHINRNVIPEVEMNN